MMIYFSLYVEYYEGGSFLHGQSSSKITECEFDRDERITNATVHHDGEKLVGLEFKTSHNNGCRSIIVPSPNIAHTSGHQLLYLSGEINNPSISSLNLYFDYDCSPNN